MKYYILFGPPGAGKGTQATAMVEKYNLHHISTGALLRKEIAAGTELGQLAKSLIEKGCLVPLPQADALDKILEKTGSEVTATVSIMIPDAMIMERIKGRALKEGRADDASEEIINTRIVTYHNQTEPLIEYYTKAEKYNEVDGTGTIEEVRDRIFTVMDRF